MEAEVIRSFLPNLVTAISDSVHSVSDHCLAKGLIPDSVYKRVLESGGTSEDKARTLVLALKTATETDDGCLEILLDILEKQLPYAANKKFLSEIRKEVTESANTIQTVQHLPSEELPRESALLKSSLLGKFEDAIRQHERACAKLCMLEEKLKIRSEEYESLKALKSQTQKACSDQSSLQRKITDCECEIETLRAKVKTLEHTIEEQRMNVKRGRNAVVLKTEKMLAVVAQKSQAEAWEKANEEIKTKEREFTLTLQEMKLRMKELELESKQYKESSQLRCVVPVDILVVGHVSTLLNSLKGEKYVNMSQQWRNLGSQLGFTTEELDEISRMSPNELPKMLHEWAKWYPGDKRGSTNFASYTDLQKALVKIGLRDVALYMLPYYELLRP